MLMVIKTVTLKGGAVVGINSATKDNCKTCGAGIYWASTSKGMQMPVEKIGEDWQSHFATCPHARDFRKIVEKVNKKYVGKNNI